MLKTTTCSLLFCLSLCLSLAHGSRRKLLQKELPSSDVEQLETDLELLDSAGSGNVDEVEKALSQDANVSGSDGFGWTPLHFAAFAGSKKITEVLLARNADIEARTVSASLKNGIFTAEQSTPLHIAAAFGNVDVIKVLIENGATVSARDFRGWKPIARAARNGHVEAVQALIDGGADVNDDGNLSPLHLAALSGHADVADTLVQGGASVSAKTSAGETPLYMASQYGREQVVKFLLSNGADPTVTANSGSYPKDVICSKNELCLPELEAELEDILKI